jgi:hypothetical protein
MVNAEGEPIVAEGIYSVSVGGGQPNTGAPSVDGTFEIKRTMTLPEKEPREDGWMAIGRARCRLASI